MPTENKCLLIAAYSFFSKILEQGPKESDFYWLVSLRMKYTEYVIKIMEIAILPEVQFTQTDTIIYTLPTHTSPHIRIHIISSDITLTYTITHTHTLLHTYTITNTELLPQLSELAAQKHCIELWCECDWMSVDDWDLS